MLTLRLEPVQSRWLSGTPQEAKQAEEILSRNWRILEPHTMSARTPGLDNLSGECKQERVLSILDNGQQDNVPYSSPSC